MTSMTLTLGYKHLPGQHDQKLHTPKKYGMGGDKYGPFGKNKHLYDITRQAILGSKPVLDYEVIGKYEKLSGKDVGDTLYKRGDGYEVFDESVKANYYDDQEGWHAKVYKPVTREQVDYVLDDLKTRAEERHAFLDQHFDLPDTMGELVGQDLYDKMLAKNYYDKNARDEFGEEFFKTVDGHFMPILQGSDMTQFSRDELEYKLFDKYDNAVNAEFGADSEQAKNMRGWINAMGDNISAYHEFEIKHQVCLGNITPDYGADLGVYEAKSPHGDSKFDFLPDVMYHATTNAAGIMMDGIKSRMELRQHMGVGLGGGADDTYSVGTDEGIVKNIERSLHEAWLVANGKLGIRDMIRHARDGNGAPRPFLMDMYGSLEGTGLDRDPNKDKYTKPDYDPDRDGVPSRVKELLALEDGKSVLHYEMGKYVAGVPSQDWVRDKMFEAWKYNFLGPRQHAGGFEDPMFFGTDWRGLAKLNPDEFKVMVYRPYSNKARGYQMSSLSEWRIIGGDVVNLDYVLDYYDADDIDDIMGVQ